MASSVPSPGLKPSPRLLRVLQIELRMRSLILSWTSLIQSQRERSPVATQPLGSTIGKTLPIAT